jgi:putative sterol carrier protein
MDQQRQQSHPHLAALRFATLKNLASSGSSADQTLNRLAELLSQSKLRGTFQLRLLREGKMEGASVHSVAFGSTKAKASTKRSKPTVELITTPETWAEIASGRTAPHDAFLGGRMRVRGDVRVAQLMLKHLAGSEGLTSVCRQEEQ